MITRSKLVEQLRDYQIRSQHKYHALTIFSPKPYITSWSYSSNSKSCSWADVVVAVIGASVFSVLVVSSYVALYFRHFWLSFVIICLGIFLPIHLRRSRHAMAKNREARLLLPLSM